MTDHPSALVSVPENDDDAARMAVFAQVDLSSAELEMEGSIYDGFAAAIMVKGQPRTVALTREYQDAVQLMAIIQRDRATLPMILDLHRSGVLSEGQVVTATGLDRIEVRARVDAISAAPAAPQAAGVGALVRQIDALLAIPDENLSARVPYLARELLERAASHLRAPSREPEGGAVDTVWRCAMTVACNIAIDEQNRTNDDDGPSDVLNAQGEIIRRLKGVLEIDRNYRSEVEAILSYEAEPFITAPSAEAALATREEPPAEAGEEWSRDDIETLISDALIDSFDVDWDTGDGAMAVRRALEKEGLLLRAQPQAREEAQPVAWLRAVDEEMVCAHLGVADAEDSFETAKKKLASLIQWNIAVATDPSVGGHPTPDALREHERLFKALRDESWDLRCFNIPTGGDDFDIGWRVIGHWQAEPHERTIAEVFSDDPVEAVRQALAVLQAEQRAK